MKKLLLILFLISSTAYAQNSASNIQCKTPTGTKIPVLCDASGNTTVNIVANVPTTAATFATMDVTLPAGIGAAYADVLDLPDGTKMVLFDNQTNGDVVISLDGGVTDHYSMKGGDTLALNLAQFGLITTVHVWVKDGTAAPASGAFNISSFK